MVEIARFWTSIAWFNPDRERYEIHGVMGPDEFHEKYPGAQEGGRAVSVTRLVDLVRACGLVVVIVTVSLASPGPGSAGARGLAIAITLGLSAAAWVAWMLSGSTGERTRLNLGSLIVMAGAGGVLAGLSPNSPAVAVGCAAAFSAGVRLRI